MRAADLRLESMLRLDPDAGRILVGDQRFVLVSANAWGVLRKDLVSVLGMERAKGFLIRYGWACGYQDAIEMRDRFPWMNDLEWWQAGPSLHGLEGIVHVRLTELRRDREQGLFYMAGVWENSFEAEQHLRYFGRQDDPVCWSLIGYASGYGSGYFGKEVVFKEISCVGREDPTCTFLGQTIDAWGDGIASELPYYREDKIVEELDRAYHRIQAQHRLLQHTAEIHQELTQLALGGQGLQALTHRLSRLTDRSVLVEDRSLRVLACHPAEARQQGLGRGRDDPVVQRGMEEMRVCGKRTKISPLPALGLPEARLVAPIGAGSRVLGYLSFLQGGREFSDLEGMVVERAAGVCANELLRQEAVLETEERIRGDLLDDLLVGRYEVETLKQRAFQAGLDLTACFQVMIVDADEHSGVCHASENGERGVTALAQELSRVVLAAVREQDPAALMKRQSGTVVVLVRVDPAAPVDEAFAARLRQAIVRQWPKLSVSIGIGTVAQGCAALSRSHQEAQQALDLYRKLGGGEVTAAYADLGIYGLLLRGHNRDELESFAHRVLGRLLDYDRLRHAQLVETLDAFLRHDGHFTRAAQHLNLQVSGLKYRLQRVEELSGFSLRDPQARLNLQVALMIWRLSHNDQKLHQTNEGGFDHGGPVSEG